MNGYTQIELGGKLRGFKWGNYAMQLYVKKSKAKDVEELGGLMESESSPLIMYCGLMMNCFRKDEEPDFTWTDVCDWIDELPMEESVSIFKTLDETIQSAQIIKDSKTLTDKKKENLPLNNGRNQKKKK